MNVMNFKAINNMKERETNKALRDYYMVDARLKEKSP